MADSATGKLVYRLLGHGAWRIFGYSFRADSKRLATVSRDHTAIIWDLTTGKAALDFDSPRGAVDALTFSPDGKTLFAGCDGDHTGGLWDSETGKLRRWLVADDKKGYPGAAEFLPDGRHILVGYRSGGTATGKEWTAKLWGVEDGKVVREFGGHTDGVRQLAMSPDGKRLATRDWGKKLRLWEIETGKLQKEIDWTLDPNPVSLTFQKTGELYGASDHARWDRSGQPDHREVRRQVEG